MKYGKVQGANVRQKEKDVINPLQDESRMRQERRSHANMRAPGAEGENQRLERESKLAVGLSLKEEEEVERGLMQAAEWSEREVDALPPPALSPPKS
jgi:hypothetical protein